MSFPPAFLDEIRARIAVSQVVGRRVALKKRGREYVGLSPFQNEKTPSFTVNDEKGFYHCFSTGEHGDIFTFLMRTEGLTFPEAVERLAGEAGLEVPKASREEQEKEKRRHSIQEVTEATCRYYQKVLRSPEGDAALRYLRGRGLDDRTIAQFRLGYAPADGDGLKKYLAAEGIDMDLALEATIFRRPNDGRAPYPFFRDRVMFPITDRRDRVIAFGGRFMGDAKAAGVGKYINSPDTPLFDKGRTLYNIANARQAAHDGEPVLIAEGYMDVIALSAAGFRGAVAPLGTALTETQIAEIWRLAEEPLLCLDGDNAGRKAARRAGERALPLLKPGKSLRFAFLPEGEDPDSLIRARGAAAMQTVIDAARPMADVLWEDERGFKPLDTPERKADLEARLMALAESIGDETVKKQYRREFSDRIWNEFRRARPQSQGRFSRGRGRDGYGGERRSEEPLGARLKVAKDQLSRRQQEVALALIVNHPRLIADYDERLSNLSFDPDLDNLRRELQKLGSSGEELDVEAIRDHFNTVGKSGLLDAVLNRQVYSLARQARADAPDEEARTLLDHILLIRTQSTLASEMREEGRGSTDVPDDGREARLMAMRAHIDDGERRLADSED